MATLQCSRCGGTRYDTSHRCEKGCGVMTATNEATLATLDGLRKRLEQVEAERDALAARNTELHDVAGILLCIDQCETCREEGEFNRDGVKRVINREAPASLARHDAELILKLADQLEEAEAPDALGGDMWDASQCADWIREQAEGGGDA